MSGASEALGKRIASAKDLGAVVRSMKALPASSIGQYEQAVAALEIYCRTIELGLGQCLRAHQSHVPAPARSSVALRGAVIVGSDQGLVGRFNEFLFEFAMRQLQSTTQRISFVGCVGERMRQLADDSHFGAGPTFAVPGSAEAVTTLVNEILIAAEKAREQAAVRELWVFHNRPMAGTGYEPVAERLFPLDVNWENRMRGVAWPSSASPEVIGENAAMLAHFTREYLFVVLFRACAESLASENATRLAAMQRADKNIAEIQVDLKRRYQSMRQCAIDEELFDVISGYELLRGRAAAISVDRA